MWPTLKTAELLLASVAVIGITTEAVGQPKNPVNAGVVQFAKGRQNPVIPGAVHLKNGLVLFGLCDSAKGITAAGPQNRRLELRRIDQQFRTYFVSTRQAAAPLQNELALPKDEFRIRQRRQSSRPLNYELGLNAHTPFRPDGRSEIELLFHDNKTVKIDLGITSLNSNRAQVDGLSHQWQFGVSMDTIPESTLYTSANGPGLLKNVTDFSSGETQLRLAEMLLQAGKFNAARLFLSDIREAFPKLESRCDRLVDSWNERVGTRALEELTILRDNGKYETARAYARQWPEQKLAPVVRVRARTFLNQLDENVQRLKLLKQSFNKLVADIDDEDLRSQAMQIVVEIERELDLNTIERITPFELSQFDTTLSAEAKLALAATGVIIGADAAIDNFPEAAGLLQIRSMIRDYLNTLDDESSVRDALLEKIRAQEGFAVERVALLLQHLPPTLKISAGDRNSQTPGVFRIEQQDEVAECIGIVPDEYSPNRRYPLIVAFSREGMSPEDTLQWWRNSANRNGYIVVVPSVYTANDVSYDASATQHRQVLNAMRILKSGLSVDDDRVFISGHGIGGEAAMDIGTAHAELFAGVVTLSSLGRRHILQTAHNSADLSWYVVAGSRHRDWLGRLKPIVEKLFKRHEVRNRNQFSDALFVRYDERGFESYAEEQISLFRWLNLQQRSSLPDRIDAAAMRSTDTSWYWLEMAEMPIRNRVLEKPSTWEDKPAGAGHIAAEISGSANLIRLRNMPSDAMLRLSPELPGLDLTKPITVMKVNGRRQTVDYAPSTRDLLDDFRDRRDRRQLCFMKVPVSR